MGLLYLYLLLNSVVVFRQKCHVMQTAVLSISVFLGIMPLSPVDICLFYK